MLRLVEQLSPKSALWASTQGGSQFRAWTPEMYLLALIANLTAAANRQRAGKRSTSLLVKPPSPASRPRARRLSIAKIAARQKALDTTN